MRQPIVRVDIHDAAVAAVQMNEALARSENERKKCSVTIATDSLIELNTTKRYENNVSDFFFVFCFTFCYNKTESM